MSGSNDGEFSDLIARLAGPGHRAAAAYPAPGDHRQPAHVVYGGAQLFSAGIAAKLGAAARRAAETHAPDPASFAHALGLGGDAEFHHVVHRRVLDKLRRAPVEDYRVDFEDGYGPRPDDEEDRDARRVGGAMAEGLAAGSLPGAVGIRIRPLGPATAARALRTLDLLLGALAGATGGALPPGFAVTLPKVDAAEQVSALAAALDRIERRERIAAGTTRIEIMVETPRALVAADGRVALPALVAAGAGRVRGAHVGPFDYTASLGIAPAHQDGRHPACDFARGLMQASLAGTGVWLADGPTATLPVGPHRDPPDGAPLALTQLDENRAAVHRAWRRHHEDVRASLRLGFPQGWDLHPAQLVSRWAAVFAFHLEGRGDAARRLRAFLGNAARATLAGTAFDDAASGRALVGFFARGLACGAFDDGDAQAAGVPAAALRSGSLEDALVAARATGAGA